MAPMDQYPAVSTTQLPFMDTACDLLPTYVSVTHPGVAAFFAGTRYTTLSDTFKVQRDAFGRCVALCGGTPTPYDILHLFTNTKLFLDAKLDGNYTAMAHMVVMKRHTKAVELYLSMHGTGAGGELRSTILGLPVKDAYPHLPAAEVP